MACDQHLAASSKPAAHCPPICPLFFRDALALMHPNSTGHRPVTDPLPSVLQVEVRRRLARMLTSGAVSTCASQQSSSELDRADAVGLLLDQRADAAVLALDAAHRRDDAQLVADQQLRVGRVRSDVCVTHPAHASGPRRQQPAPAIDAGHAGLRERMPRRLNAGGGRLLRCLLQVSLAVDGNTRPLVSAAAAAVCVCVRASVRCRGVCGAGAGGSYRG